MTVRDLRRQAVQQLTVAVVLRRILGTAKNPGWSNSIADQCWSGFGTWEVHKAAPISEDAFSHHLSRNRPTPDLQVSRLLSVVWELCQLS